MTNRCGERLAVHIHVSCVICASTSKPALRTIAGTHALSGAHQLAGSSARRCSFFILISSSPSSSSSSFFSLVTYGGASVIHIDAGYQVVRAARLNDAMTIARREHIDAAILDVNLHGEAVYPLASQLHEAGVPFMFASAYGKPDIPEAFSRYRVMSKPYPINDPIPAVEGLLEDSGRQGWGQHAARHAHAGSPGPLKQCNFFVPGRLPCLPAGRLRREGAHISRVRMRPCSKGRHWPTNATPH